MNSPAQFNPIRIFPALKTYSWGMRQRDSRVALLHRASGIQVPHSTTEPFAEVWYGAHESGPAIADFSSPPGQSQQLPLNQFLARFPELLGKYPEMPFQAKVLSVGEPLSIQLHPTESEAKRLRSEKPHLYPDSYPKCEAGLALTEVELLIGFRPNLQMAVFQYYPEIASLLPTTLSSTNNADLARQLWLELFKRSQNPSQKQSLEEATTQLLSRLKNKTDREPQETWALSLEGRDEKADLGVILFLLLNYVKLSPNQAIRIPPGRVHAYLSGELAEIMLPGDCCIRLGRTPKPKDLEEVISCADFTVSDPEQDLLPPDARQGMTRFTAKFPNDSQSELHFDSYNQPGKSTLEESSAPRILLCLEGDGELSAPGKGVISITQGTALLLPAHLPNFELSLRSGHTIIFSV